MLVFLRKELVSSGQPQIYLVAKNDIELLILFPLTTSSMFFHRKYSISTNFLFIISSIYPSDMLQSSALIGYYLLTSPGIYDTVLPMLSHLSLGMILFILVGGH